MAFPHVDQAYGHALARDTSELVKLNGGRWSATPCFRRTLPTSHRSCSPHPGAGANVIAIAASSGDTVTALKQADEFGLSAKAKIVPLQSVLTDVYAVGLKTAHDAYEVSPFYWHRTPETRTWAECFYAGGPPVGPSLACVSRVLAVLSGIAGSRKTPHRASVVAPTWPRTHVSPARLRSGRA
jgi:ABC-type branched-subunit amino acid transport system substrate-binding protein